MPRAFRIFAVLTIFVLALPLSACSGGRDEIAETIDVTSDMPRDEITEIEEITPAPVLTQPTQTQPPQTMADSVALSGNSAVDVFAFDAPVSAAPPQQRQTFTQPVRGFAVNDNVEVFPLDGPVNQPAMNQPAFVPPAYAQTAQAPVPVPQPAPQTQVVPQQPAGAVNSVTMKIAGQGGQVIYFDHDSITVNAEGLAIVQGMAQAFSSMPEHILSVEGHASSRAATDNQVQARVINMRVSMQRAYNVAKALIEAGVPAKAVRAVAWGDSFAKPGPDGEKAARRVEILPMTGQK